jgi:hypothetical protein
MVEQGELVNVDRSTYTVSGEPLRDANWLTQLLYYHLSQLGGLALIQFVNSLILALMMALLVAQCRRAGGSLLVATAIGVFMVFGLLQLVIVRPQTISLFLFVLLSIVLELASDRRWLLCAPPLILALWCNVHGGFPIGLFLIGSHLLGIACESLWTQRWGVLRDGRVWSFAGCLVASAGATLINPYGWHIYEYVAITATSAASRGIDEWLPPTLNLLVGKMLLASVVLLVVLLALPGKRPTIRQACLLVCFLPVAYSSMRMIAWWFLITAPIFSFLLADRIPRWILAHDQAKRLSWVDGVALVCILFASLLCIPALERYNPVLNDTPRGHRMEYDLAQVADQLREQPGHRIFSRLEWSEYLGWALAPRYTVFMDGRIEIFSDRIWDEYDCVTRGRAKWQEILDRYEVDYLLLDKTGYHAGLLAEVETSPRWQRKMECGDAVLFSRRSEDAVTVR